MQHIYVVAKGPFSVSLPSVRIDEYIGYYSAADALLAVIARERDHLTLSLHNKRAKPLPRARCSFLISRVV